MPSSTIVQTLARVSLPGRAERLEDAFLGTNASLQPFTDLSNLLRPLLHSERGIGSEQGISSERARSIHHARRQNRGVGSGDLDREDVAEHGKPEPLGKRDEYGKERQNPGGSTSHFDAPTTSHLAGPASTYATRSQSPSASDDHPPWPFHSPPLSSSPEPFHHRFSSATSLTDPTSSRIPSPTPLTPPNKHRLRLSATERQQHNPSPDLIKTCPSPPSSAFRPGSRQRNLLPSRFIEDDGGAGSFEENSEDSSDDDDKEELLLDDEDGEEDWIRNNYPSPETSPLQFLASSLLTAAYDRPLRTTQHLPPRRHSMYAQTPLSTVHSRSSDTTLFTYDLGSSLRPFHFAC